MLSTSQQTIYDSARTSAALYRIPDAGYLTIQGEHQNDYIQRQTTNDIRDLTPDRALLTVLTSATARMLDVWRLIREPDGIGAITLPGRGASTTKYLQSRIFFMDRVTVQHRSADFAQFMLVGPAAPEVLRGLGISDPPGPDALLSVSVDGIPIRVLGPHPAVSLGYHLIVPAASAEAFSARLSGVVALSPELYDLLRIEAGLPASGHELTDDFTPLEANLDAAISDRKGCYTGQEVIARQVNYDKITRRLVGLRLEHPVNLGSAVLVEGRSVGQITSAAESPRWGAVALAVLRRPHHEPGTPVTVAGDSPTAGTVTALPLA